MQNLSFSNQGLNPHPVQWNLRVLTTGPLGKSLIVCVCMCVLSGIRLFCDPIDTKPTRLLCPLDIPGKNTRAVCHFLFRKAMTNLDSILKSRGITLSTKACLVKVMVLLVTMYGCEGWTIKKAECRRIDAFELWCWRRLLRVPWTARRSN